LQAQLLVPSRPVGFIEPGDRVLLRYQAFPYQKFGHHGGKVIRVSRSAINPETTGAQTTEPYYRVLVALDRQDITAYGRPEPLRPGMVLDADILGER
jgi:membrane fusion protein